MADPRDLREPLAVSLRRQERVARSSLILNPVENFPFPDDLAPASGFLHGLYNSDKVRTTSQQRDSIIQFAGRNRIAYDVRRIYRAWAEALGAADATLRLLSGLHAHTVLFMACTKAGERVLLLPELGGGHVSTRSILERLGLEVVEMAIDTANMCIDVPQTMRIVRDRPPDFVFVDRSEGLIYEDFTELVATVGAPSVFDASQYLSNIIAGHFGNPFDMGFDFLVSTLHKNFPGPQRALLATREENDRWRDVLAGISTYVSNMHGFGIYTAGFTLQRTRWLQAYSQRMLSGAVSLENELALRGQTVVRRPAGRPPTHHVWLTCRSAEEAFAFFKALERCRILVNYRKLPYGLGMGLRLGLSFAARLGLEVADIPRLADMIVSIKERGPTAFNRFKAREFNQALWTRYDGLTETGWD